MNRVALALALIPFSAAAATLEVGPGKPFSKPCAAIAAAQPGDVIEVDAAGNGTYDGDHCAWSTDQLTVRGVHGRARIDAGKVQANIAQDKGIFVIYAPNATVESFELSGAVDDPNSKNGAGIRHQGLNLVVRDCYFHDNEDGILGGPLENGQNADGQGSVEIDNSEFSHNGHGDGYSHNMYLGHYAHFTLRASYSHGALVGHLVKSRALENRILYNRITDEPGTTASYELDLPNGGLSYVIGNLIEQGAQTQNSGIVTYAEEGGTNPDQHLFFVNNTVVNDLNKGTFVAVAGNTPAQLTNNVFVGSGTVTTQANAMQQGNWVAAMMGDPKLVNPAAFDYHLAAGSPCIDQGVDPGMANGQLLAPDSEYVHPASSEARAVVGKAIDVGAYEFGNQPPPDGGAAADLATANDLAMAVAVDSAMAPTGDSAIAPADMAVASDMAPAPDFARAGDFGAAGDSGAGTSPDGCSCGIGGRPARPHAALFLALAALAFVARRRRR